MVVRSHDAALENGEISLDCVRVDVAAHILANAVIDSLVAGKHAADTRAATVAHDVGRSVKLLI